MRSGANLFSVVAIGPADLRALVVCAPVLDHALDGLLIGDLLVKHRSRKRREFCVTGESESHQLLDREVRNPRLQVSRQEFAHPHPFFKTNDAILNSQADYYEVQRGTTLALGELKFMVLNPGETMEDDLNQNSLVLRLAYGQTTFLFMGDAGSTADNSMMAAGQPLKADILKIAHHASCSSLNKSFLQAVQPEVGIYSAGADNQYGYPCAQTIDTLNQYGVLVLGTDVNGSIIVTATMDGYTITDSAGNVLRR